MCTEKGQGGLGLRKLSIPNKALLGKWIWRFALEMKIKWKHLISSKYGEENLNWNSREARGPFGGGILEGNP